MRIILEFCFEPIDKQRRLKISSARGDFYLSRITSLLLVPIARRYRISAAAYPVSISILYTHKKIERCEYCLLAILWRRKQINNFKWQLLGIAH